MNKSAYNSTNGLDKKKLTYQDNNYPKKYFKNYKIVGVTQFFFI